MTLPPQFRIIRTKYLHELEDKISAYMQEGWKLHGHILTGEEYFSQAITLGYIR
jgi:Domain of unknown function (DUF1737)